MSKTGITEAFQSMAEAISSGLREAEIRRMEKYIAAEDCRGILMHLWSKGRLSDGWNWYSKDQLHRAAAVMKKHGVPFPNADVMSKMGTTDFSLKYLIDQL